MVLLDIKAGTSQTIARKRIGLRKEGKDITFELCIFFAVVHIIIKRQRRHLSIQQCIMFIVGPVSYYLISDLANEMATNVRNRNTVIFYEL